jgi:hypothetical protein
MKEWQPAAALSAMENFEAPIETQAGNRVNGNFPRREFRRRQLGGFDEAFPPQPIFS